MVTGGSPKVLFPPWLYLMDVTSWPPGPLTLTVFAGSRKILLLTSFLVSSPPVRQIYKSNNLFVVQVVIILEFPTVDKCEMVFLAHSIFIVVHPFLVVRFPRSFFRTPHSVTYAFEE